MTVDLRSPKHVVENSINVEEIQMGENRVLLKENSIEITDQKSKLLFKKKYPSCKISTVFISDSNLLSAPNLVLDIESESGMHQLVALAVEKDVVRELSKLNTFDIQFDSTQSETQSNQLVLTGEKIFEDWGRAGVAAKIKLSWNKGAFQITRELISTKVIQEFINARLKTSELVQSAEIITPAQLESPEFAEFLLQLICSRQETEADRLLRVCWKGSRDSLKEYRSFIFGKSPHIIPIGTCVETGIKPETEIGSGTEIGPETEIGSGTEIGPGNSNQNTSLREKSVPEYELSFGPR